MFYSGNKTLLIGVLGTRIKELQIIYKIEPVSFESKGTSIVRETN